MIKLEKILKSDFYPLILSLVAAVAWMFNGNLAGINKTFIVIYLLLAAFILVTFKDTSYTIQYF